MTPDTITPQQYADQRYAFRKIKNYSGASENTMEDVAEQFPSLSNEEINDIVFESTINYSERNIPLENNND